MRAFLWKALYAVVCVVIFLWIFPMFMAVVGFSPAAQVWTLVRALVACIAVLYVLFGPPPPTPF